MKPRKLYMRECKHGYTYRIDARNASFGVYDEKEKGFWISRRKMGDNFLFIEYHWDTGEPFGTAIPYDELENAKGFKFDYNCVEDLSYLNTMIGKYGEDDV